MDSTFDIFLTAKAEAIAALGWEGYLRGGRGVVLLSLDDGTYLGKQVIKQSFPGPNKIRRQLLQWLAAYDPQREVLVLLPLRDPGRPVTWLYRRWMPPVSREETLLAQVGTAGCPPLKTLGVDHWDEQAVHGRMMSKEAAYA